MEQIRFPWHCTAPTLNNPSDLSKHSKHLFFQSETSCEMQKHHTRRKRRQAKMKIRSKGKFKVNHNNPAGRTGSVHSRHERRHEPFPRLRFGLGWSRKKPDAAEATPGQVTFGEPIAGSYIAGHGLPAIHEATYAANFERSR